MTPVVAPAPLPGFAVRGEKAHSKQSAVRRSSTVPPSRRGIAGNPARRLGWRPTEKTKGRLGPSRRGGDLLKSFADPVGLEGELRRKRRAAGDMS